MGSNTLEEGENSYHTIQLGEVINEKRLASIQQKINSTPELLTHSADLSSCSIFRVPQSLIDVNGRVYQPDIVSIGPYHHGDPKLQMIEEHKWRLLGALLSRTQSKLRLYLEDYFKAIQPLEAEARECYSKDIPLDEDRFLEMLVLDGCFIIELFRSFGRAVPWELGDPLLSLSWVFNLLLRDLILVENQIPFFVLQRLFNITIIPGEEEDDTALSKLALYFFNYGFDLPFGTIDRHECGNRKHLLDLLRSTFIPQFSREQITVIPQKGPSRGKFVPISKLRHSGIKVTARRSNKLLAVNFKRGEIQMPTIMFDYLMSCFMANCVAFEQCHRNCSKHFSTYVIYWDSLIKTSKDVKYLSDQNVIINCLGTDDDIVKFIQNLAKHLYIDGDSFYLYSFFEEVDKHYRSAWQHYKNNWHVQWAKFWNTYFRSPWTFISLVAAVLLLVATLLQTYYTILAYVKPK